MATKQLYSLLEKLQLRKKLDGRYEERNVAYRQHNDNQLTYRGIFSIDLASRLEIIGPDAVYYFNRQPLILFFDFSEGSNNAGFVNRKDNIFKQAWCLDKSPVVFVLNKDDIQIFNAFRYERSIDGTGGLEVIGLDQDQIEKKFSFWELQSGKTWEWIDDSIFKSTIEKARVNYVLFNNILFASETLTSFGLSKEFANLLILRFIFCRYLIDRGVEFNPQYLKGKTIEERKQRFNEILSNE